MSNVDVKDHYGVIIIGAGVSGLAASIQLKRKLGFTDVIIYEKANDIGGTWRANTYPGAGCDIPVSFYSFSFAKSADFSSQWAQQGEIMRYLKGVQRDFKVNNIVFETSVLDATWSALKGLWTVNIKDERTGKKSSKTCNVFITACGALSVPNVPTFPGQETFEGSIFHSAQWDHSVEVKGKDVVVIGNGCSAIQIVPAIIDEVGALTQIARSRQSILRRPAIPDSAVWSWMLKHVPGCLWLQRTVLFFAFEASFLVSDILRGAAMRKAAIMDTEKYIQETAPKKYWDHLMPDFDVAAKRRIFDSGYYLALNKPNFSLIEGSIQEFKKHSVVVSTGEEVKADIIVLSTGFKAQDFLFPLKVYNDSGESLQQRFKATNVANYQGTCVASFPNLFTLMGPNTTTGHSSVIFTSECQITMILKLVKPVLASLSKKSIGPAPSVVVRDEAQRAYMEKLRAEMRNKVWEKDGGKSWYVDRTTGICTTLYPWSQIDFWRKSRNVDEGNFLRVV